ncbi:MAG: bifunctional phosphoribosyl-AMP cyclohydrolase/phosphoribosyl-ATP diphosphatase HisIE [Clostridiales bacterium]|jgi:phosphoribosylformimino-5-aminoimidazole carboxamide ribotide isomerase|nr:bifunctional phosphoribosyl-AMP cyclohydrolase/phosphoribosyl-ATP diphosphatase HisIE [Clostridiales bacterium]
MRIYPAIDIRGGRCVRLKQGDFSRATEFFDDPADAARAWIAAGASYLHVVDLDGAKGGAGVNGGAVARIAALRAPVQTGGGVRTLSDIEDRLALGVSRVIIGTAAVRDPAFVSEAVRLFGDKIAVGVDARDGFVATHGWLKTSGVRAVTFCQDMARRGVSAIIYTDISRDGMMSGMNAEATAEIIRACPGVGVVASGGVSSMDDLAAAERIGAAGAIIGRALFDGAIDLAEAVRVYEGGILPEPAKFRPEPAKFWPESAKFRQEIPEEIRFGADGLIPAVAADAETNEVLMLAYMNAESLALTLETGFAHYYSRSRRSLWKKGETSGHTQRVRAVRYDCDGDAILLAVEQTGAACHTGSRSCFFRSIGGDAAPPTTAALADLYRVVSDRRGNPSDGSYTSALFSGGIDRILKKVGEEAAETIIAAKNRDKREVVYEVADLLYHLTVMLAEQGVTWGDIAGELAGRFGKKKAEYRKY